MLTFKKRSKDIIDADNTRVVMERQKDGQNNKSKAGRVKEKVSYRDVQHLKTGSIPSWKKCNNSFLFISGTSCNETRHLFSNLDLGGAEPW